MSDFKPQPRPKNPVDDIKLRLSCPPTQGATRPGSLAFSVFCTEKGPHCRIDVYTNVPNDKNNGNIRAAMDAPVFYDMMQMVEIAADAEPGYKSFIENLNHTYFGGKRSEEAELVSKTIIGKDAEGRVFISVIAQGRPNLKFVFLPSFYHHLCNSDGSRMSEADASKIHAKGFVKLLRDLASSVLYHTYVEPKPRDPQQGRGGAGGGGGGRSGYQQNQNQNRGGGQQPASQSNDSFDGDDGWPM